MGLQPIALGIEHFGVGFPRVAVGRPLDRGRQRLDVATGTIWWLCYGLRIDRKGLKFQTPQLPALSSGAPEIVAAIGKVARISIRVGGRSSAHI